MSDDWDAIVIGSGITGGWAAKELCEKGLKTLVVERGRHIEHGGPEYRDFVAPWEVPNRNLVPQEWASDGYEMLSRKDSVYRMDRLHFFANQEDYPYSYPEDRPFMWTRGYQLGGRSLTWARHSYRLSDLDFEANAQDGHGVDWPIRYRDLAPWYDYVETFAGVAGNRDGIDWLPDGALQPPFEMNCAERHFVEQMRANAPGRHVIIGRTANLTRPTQEQSTLGRTRCQARDVCATGCGFGAYFSSLSATLPAAERTGNLTIATDEICHSLVFDEEAGRVTGVRVIDADTRATRTHTGRVVFLCASTIASAQILLNSATERFPDGLANSSGALGRYLMDHVGRAAGSGFYPRFRDRFEYGRRPTSLYIPRFRNVSEPAEGFVRGYGFQGSGSPVRTGLPSNRPGIGARTKDEAGTMLGWRIGFSMFGEMLPYAENRVTLHPTKKDKWGIPLVHIDAKYGANEIAMIKQAAIDLRDILLAGGCSDVEVEHPFNLLPGSRTHEMGTARMGRDPATSVLNGWNQAHDVPNLFVTDGSCMTSSANQNPSLTFMALTARAADYAVDLVKAGKI
jgi:choline dehydrogenase-like flavoprotein